MQLQKQKHFLSKEQPDANRLHERGGCINVNYSGVTTLAQQNGV